MSTTFGILKAGLTWDEETPIPGECFVKVAFRTNSGGMYWLNDAGTALPDDMKVYPIAFLDLSENGECGWMQIDAAGFA